MAHEGHSDHLCALVGLGIDDKYKAKIKDAKFVCSKCGRAAAEEKSLCAPIPIK